MLSNELLSIIYILLYFLFYKYTINYPILNYFIFIIIIFHIQKNINYNDYDYDNCIFDFI
jgi:hypothetical protein